MVTERKREERRSVRRRALRYPEWNLKYRASRTSMLAPETRETRCRDTARLATSVGLSSSSSSRTWKQNLDATMRASPLSNPRNWLEFSDKKIKIPIHQYRYTAVTGTRHEILQRSESISDVNFEHTLKEKCLLFVMINA